MLALAACGGKTAPGSGAPSASYSPPVTDPGQVIEVKAGEEFKITLESDFSTDLHWELAVALNTAVVDFVSKEFITKGAANSVGSDVWTFTAIAPGETTITFGYYRGNTEETAKMAEFKIVVK